MNGLCRRIAGDLAAVRAWGAYLRAAASPGSAFAMHQQWWATDVRDVLSSVRAPTLVLTRPDAAFIDLVQPFATEIEMRVPGARMVELPGRDFPFYFGDRAAFVAELEEFFTGARSAVDDGRASRTRDRPVHGYRRLDGTIRRCR